MTHHVHSSHPHTHPHPPLARYVRVMSLMFVLIPYDVLIPCAAVSAVTALRSVVASQRLGSERVSVSPVRPPSASFASPSQQQPCPATVSVTTAGVATQTSPRFEVAAAMVPPAHRRHVDADSAASLRQQSSAAATASDDAPLCTCGAACPVDAHAPRVPRTAQRLGGGGDAGYTARATPSPRSTSPIRQSRGSAAANATATVRGGSSGRDRVHDGVTRRNSGTRGGGGDAVRTGHNWQSEEATGSRHAAATSPHVNSDAAASRVFLDASGMLLEAIQRSYTSFFRTEPLPGLPPPLRAALSDIGA